MQVVQALKTQVSAMGQTYDRLMITNYWMAKQDRFFQDLEKWIGGRQNPFGALVAKINKWLVSYFSRVSFLLEYKTMQAKIKIGNEFSQMMAEKWLNRRLAILFARDRGNICTIFLRLSMLQ